MNYALQFLLGFLSTIGFAVLFHVPRKNIILSSVVGAIGWTIFVFFRDEFGSAFIGGFLASCAIGFGADLNARLCREPATVFIIPGIIPLVPGAGMYYTTLYLINGQLETAAMKGTETLLMAGAISVGLLTEESLFRIYLVLKHKLTGIKNLKGA